jgi:hypothetical protein
MLDGIYYLKSKLKMPCLASIYLLLFSYTGFEKNGLMTTESLGIKIGLHCAYIDS